MIDEILSKIRHKKPVITAVFVSAGLLAGWTLYGRSMLTQLRTLERERATLVQKTTLAQSIAGIEQRLMDYQARLTEGKKKGWFLEEINAVAKESGFTILAVEPQQRHDIGNDLELLSARVEADADFHELGEFLSRLESAKSAFKVVQVEIEAVSDYENPGSEYTPSGAGARRPESMKNKLYSVSLTLGVLGPTRNLSS